MKGKSMLIGVGITVALGVLATGAAISAQDRYTLKVPNGLAFSEFKGYEDWQVISISHNGALMAVILGNPAMIEAYRAGVPGTASLSPTAPRWRRSIGTRKRTKRAPVSRRYPHLHDIDFMAKDSKRFADSGGWGYAEFEYEAASDFGPAHWRITPPQGNDAKCGFACHTVVKQRDYIFHGVPQEMM